MEKRNYLLLVALNVKLPQAATGVLERVKTTVDTNAAARWIDATGAGIFISTHLSALEVWTAAVPRDLPTAHDQALKEVLVVQLGPDHAASPDTRSAAWLNAHRA